MLRKNNVLLYPNRHGSSLEGRTYLQVRILDFGSDIEATNAAGMTPLQVAAAHSSEDATRMLAQPKRMLKLWRRTVEHPFVLPSS